MYVYYIIYSYNPVTCSYEYITYCDCVKKYLFLVWSCGRLQVNSDLF